MADGPPNFPKRPPVVVASSRESDSRIRRESKATREATGQHSSQEKLAIFADLFRGRADVYPVRWENASRGTSGYMPDCSNKFVRPLCDLRRTKCSKCKNQAFRPLDERAIFHHLRGTHTIGVYPLLHDGTCWFLALDFDDKSWRKDVTLVRDICDSMSLPAYIERSRSGEGAHLWLFFSEPVVATDARALGSLLLTRAQEHAPSFSLRSYDRMFPSQGTLTKGGFGNLIALPLQRSPRNQNNSVFLNRELEPFAEQQQWDLLGKIQHVSPEKLTLALEQRPNVQNSENESTAPKNLGRTGDPFDQGNRRSLRELGAAKEGTSELVVTVRDRVYVVRDQLSSELQAKIRDLAMFSNPEYFQRKAARASTWKTPRVIRCAEISEAHIILPRGCESALRGLAKEVELDVRQIDQRQVGAPIFATFQGTLTPLQTEALNAALSQDMGVLVLPTGMGKTVVACALIAERGVSTLIIVNRRHLLNQWRAQLSVFLDVSESDIGQLGSSKSHPCGKIDVAMVQSLARGDPTHTLGNYGQIIVDECHHAAAKSFEDILSQVPARYFLGLTATPRRRDEHHPIMHMQLGPVLFKTSARKAAALRPFSHRFFVRRTELEILDQPETLSGLQTRLSQDERRNSFILDDAVAAIRDDRSPLLLCQRREHVLWLAERLERYAPQLFVLMGGDNARVSRERLESLRELPSAVQRVVIATGSFIGEGFDDPRLDTLLLAAPISWKGMLSQYTGRLHRLHQDKKEVWAFDYVDTSVPTLEKMFQKRATGYRSLGYIEGEPPDEFEVLGDPSLEDKGYWEDEEVTAYCRA